MDIPANLLPAGYLWTGAALYGSLLCLALWSAPWLKIGDSEAANAWLGAVVMSLVVACRPRRVATFHDRWYLQCK